MKPLRIYLKNFMNHRESEVDCTRFQSALVVGKTKNDDEVSNGVGKTTVFNAIEYALFNASYATTLDKIVRDGKKKCKVEFDFEIDGVTYRIYRHRTAKGTADLRLYRKAGNVWETISERTPTETEKKLKEIVKVSHKAFECSVLFRQADLTGLSTADPKQRKELLKEPLNLSPYTRLEKIAKERTTPIRKKIGQLEASIDMLGNPQADIDRAETSLEVCREFIKQSEKNIEQLQGKLKKLQGQRDNLKELLTQSDADIERRLDEERRRYETLREKVSKAKVANDSAQEDTKHQEQKYRDLKEQAHTLYCELERLQRHEMRSLEDVQQELDELLKKEREGQEMTATGRVECHHAQERMQRSLDDSCPTCEQGISTEYRSRFKAVATRDFQQKEEFVEQCTQAMKRLQEKKALVEKELEEVKGLQEKIAKIKQDKVAKDEMVPIVEESRGKAVKLARERKAELDKAKEEKATSKEKLADLQIAADKSNAAELTDKLSAVNKQITTQEKEIEEVREQVASRKEDEGGLKERIRSRGEDLKKLEKLQVDELDEQNKSLRLHQKVANAFSHKGIPTFIIHTILDELQIETNRALKELRPDLEIQLDADLNITYKRDGHPRDYGQLSHGQHVYIALSFKRGLSRVIQKKLGVDIRMLEFDEVDSPLDKAGEKAFARAVRRWQKEFTIFVVTHNDRLKDRFSHAILVEEDDDGAEARLVTSW
jgi:DNA repair exonuclease SbcCD ATPase subunit